MSIHMIDDLYVFLARFGFNEPLHSPITHMPIGLAMGALIFFLFALLFKKKNLILTARHASILAFVFVFPTILLGVFDWVHFYQASLYTPIKIKMGLASLALVFLGCGIILGSEIKLHSISMAIIYAATCIVMTGLGYFGAGIIYGRGLEMKIPHQKTAQSTNKGAPDSLSNSRQAVPGQAPVKSPGDTIIPNKTRQ
jgi:uncharacterized membrane protein